MSKVEVSHRDAELSQLRVEMNDIIGQLALRDEANQRLEAGEHVVTFRMFVQQHASAQASHSHNTPFLLPHGLELKHATQQAEQQKLRLEEQVSECGSPQPPAVLSRRRLD
jgi:hypothetical protein